MGRIRRMGEAYSAGDVTVTVAGMRDVDPNAISYGYSYAHAKQQGLRRKARAWRMGTQTMEGSITLPIDVAAEFEKIAPRGDIARIRPFPINVVFLNAENEMIRDVIIAKFTGNARSVTGDEDIANEYELFVLDIQLNPDYALGTQIAHKFLIFAVLALRIRTIFCDFRKTQALIISALKLQDVSKFSNA